MQYINVTSSLCQPCSSNPCWRPTGDSGEVPRKSAYLQAVERFHALLPQLRLEEPLPLLIAFMFGKKNGGLLVDVAGFCWGFAGGIYLPYFLWNHSCFHLFLYASVRCPCSLTPIPWTTDPKLLLLVKSSFNQTLVCILEFELSNIISIFLFICISMLYSYSYLLSHS